ncbi:I78 family peptidase inhibitor [Sphingomonas sp. ac-8]|uniref:I78 family peptidase inhibitor n=1 Tax=Sphingomonas sp. ac-8 TaxID=3242977 RepID=UPI003A8009FF
MIKKLLPLLALAGCTPAMTAEAPQTGSDVDAGMKGTCRIEPIADLVGKPGSSELAADALKRSGAKSIRWINPDSMVTMDYRVDRLNIELDASGTVTRFRCG